ncbi:hypothetical protein SDC9_169497 [bioreactor metagenome]|uniref:Uncharacterized protein n=1 Tax=bioreactor metagenome TaxID=1076179 RepID=A0A645GDM1_9ZZZZ
MGQALVLNHNWNVRFAKAQIKFFGKVFFLVIPNDEEGCQTHVCLLGRQSVRVRMIPVGASPIRDGE